MSKFTIFGEENFLIPNLATEFHKEMIEYVNDKFIGQIACDFLLDKDKVKRQLELCAELENIDKTELIDMATKKKITDLQSQLAKKDEEIKYYESEWKDCKQKLDHYIGECINLQDEQNQKAIEQLEKAREIINDKYQYSLKLEQQGDLTDYGKGRQTLCCLLLKQIDHQINELKGEKHYVHT